MVAIVLSAGLGKCEDSDQTRYYLGLNFGESNPVTKASDEWGGSLGVNFDRHVGVELAVDKFELYLFNSARKVGEVKIFSIVPQLRLRQPLFDDRLVPYLIAGTGLGVTQLNDTTVPTTWSSGKTDVRILASVGGGIEYFLLDNIAFGVEGKYLISGTGQFSAQGETNSIDLSTGLLTFGFRLFYPQLRPAEIGQAARAGKTRFYGAVRIGGAVNTATQIYPDVTASGGIPGSGFSLCYGAAIGADFGKYAGIELSLENYEPKIAVAGAGSVGEYALFPVILQGRLRYPLMAGRLEPYLIGGVGAEKAEINDGKASTKGLGLSDDGFAVVGSIGAGVQYFVMDNIAVTFELKYIISRGHSFTIGEETMQNGNLDALLFTIGLRAYLLDL
jgi:opacity protein-like surface antigen